MPIEIQSKTILNKTKKRDHLFLGDYTLNPFSGCSFNCLYCYIRGSKYGEHMEDKLAIKINAPELLEQKLRSLTKKEKYGFIVFSSATDPYLQFENDLQLTRQLLEIIAHYRFPVHIITKSEMIHRDVDVLTRIKENAILPEDLRDKVKGGCVISYSFSTIDDDVAKIFEPGAPAPSTRMKSIEKLLELDFCTGISFMPLLPYISDTGEKLEEAFTLFSNMRVNHIFPFSITLFGTERGDSKPMVMRAIEKYYPHLLSRYHKLFDTRDEMPSYYFIAFQKKMQELLHKHNLKDRIY